MERSIFKFLSTVVMATCRIYLPVLYHVVTSKSSMRYRAGRSSTRLCIVECENKLKMMRIVSMLEFFSIMSSLELILQLECRVYGS